MIPFCRPPPAVAGKRGGEAFWAGTQGGRHVVPLPWAIHSSPRWGFSRRTIAAVIHFPSLASPAILEYGQMTRGAGTRGAIFIPTRFEPADRPGTCQASLDNILPYCLNRIRPADDKLARVRVNNLSGIGMGCNFGWVSAAFYRFNQMSIIDKPCASPLVCIRAVRMAEP